MASPKYLLFTDFYEGECQTIFILVHYDLINSILKLAAIPEVSTGYLYCEVSQPGWQILEERHPAYLRCRKSSAHCHSCLPTPMFKNKRKCKHSRV